MSFHRFAKIAWSLLVVVILLLVNLPMRISATYAYGPGSDLTTTAQAPLPFSFPDEVTSLFDLIPPELSQVRVRRQQIETTTGLVSGERAVLGNDGGAALFLSEQFLLLVNRGLLTTDQTIRVYETDIAEASAAPEGGLLRFQIDADGIFTNVLSQPIYLAFDMRSYDVGEREWFVVRRSEENASIWEYLPVNTYDSTGLFSVPSDYLTGDIIVGAYDYQPAGLASLMSIGGEIDADPAPWRYQWTLPTVSSFSGAATYSYPIEVPPGRNGLQPNIDISYSSRGVDGPIVSDGQDQGPLGLGWNINNIEITRSGMDMVETANGCVAELPDSFSLVLGGQSHRLVPYGDPGNYQAANNPGIRVRMVQNLTATNINSDGIYWTVETPNGTTYRLGYNEEAETGLTVQYGSFNQQGGGHQYIGKRSTYAGFRWRVDTSTDVYGNQVQYTYDEWDETDTDSCGDHGTNFYATNAQLEEIRYNFVNLAPNANTPVTGNHASLIHFELNGAHRVEQIKLFHSDLVNPYQVIDIGLGQAGGNNLTCSHGEWDSITQLVTYIQQESGDELYQLPKTEFGYIPQLHGAKSGEIHPTDPTKNCWQYQYLHTVENGYGGSMQFNYQGDGRASYPYIWFDIDNDQVLDWVESNVPDYGQSYVVTSVYAWDGMHGDVPTVVDYTYDAPCYDQTDGDLGNLANAFHCATLGQTGHGNLVGFESTTQTHYAYGNSTQIRGAVINKSETVFSQNTATNLGQPLEQYTYDESDILLNEVLTSYQTETVNNVGNAFTYASTITNTVYEDTNSLYTKVNNYYEIDFQGDQQWGRLTRQDTFFLNPDGQEELANHQITRFVTNDTDWLIAPWVTGTYDDQWLPKQVTLFEYDDNSNNPDTQSLDKGELTRTRVLLVDNPLISGTKIFSSIDTLYDYDDFGNQTEVTTYTDYGQAGNDGVDWNYSVPSDSSSASTTTIGYDSPYHLYPVTTDGPVAGYSIDFEVYGFNGIGLDGFQKQPGLLKRMIDANGLSNIYEYDPFGRLFAAYEPGDSRGTVSNPWDGDPAKRIRYWDNSWNFSGSSPFTWNGPFDSSTLPGSGSIQAQTAYVLGNKLHQDIWQNNQAWTRAVDIVEGVPNFINAPAFVRSYTTPLPGSGEVQSATYYVLGDKLHQGIWQGGQAWARTVDIVAGAPDWNNAPAFGGPYSVALSGTSEVQSQTAFAINNVLYQGMWQGNQGFSRTVPIEENSPDWDNASDWSDPILANSMPGQGDMQSQASYVIGDVLYQGFWRGDAGYARSIPIFNGQPQWRQYFPFHITEQIRPLDYPDPDLTGIGSSTLDAITYYDGFGRPVQTRQRYANVDGLGQQDIINLTQYNALGQVECASVPFAITTAPSWFTGSCATYDHTLSNYDALGRPVKMTAPDGSESIYHYGIVDHLRYVDVTNPNRQRIQHRYDALGRLVQVDEIEGNCGDYWVSEGLGCGGNHTSAWGVYATTLYAYDIANNLTSVTQSPDGTTNFTTTMTYDALGRKLTMDDPDMGNWTYQYNAASQLIRQEANLAEPEGESICFYYDEFGQLERSITPTSAMAACPANVDSAPVTGQNHLATYVYGDSVPNWGYLREIKWGDSPDQNKDVFTYDSLGRVTLQERFLDGRRYAAQTIQFDSLSRPLQTRLQYPGGQDDVVTIAYDREGANALTMGSTPLVSDIRFNANGQLARLVRNSNVPETLYNYYDATSNSSWAGDSNFRMSSIQHIQDSSTLLDFTYHYDVGGNIEQIISHAEDGTDTQTFTYDDLNRLTAVSGSYTQDYAYDRMGNMTLSDGHELGYGQAEGVATGIQPHAVTHYDGNLQFIYDAHGNMISREDENGIFTQNFDAQNRLVQVIESGGGTTQFFYDAAGQRVKTIKPNGAIIYTPFPNLEEEIWPTSTVLPTVSLTANGQTSLQLAPNSDFTLAWNSTAVRCEAEGDWSGSKAVSGSQSFSGFSSGTRSYSLTCYNSSGPHTVTVTVEVPPIPVVDLTANGQSSITILPNASFNLQWSSSNTSSCDLSWSSSQATSGSQTISGLAAGSYTYSMTCQNAAGSNSDSVTVTVMPKPTVTLTADYQSSLTIAPNTSFTLRWEAVNAASCTASGNWSGSKSLNGSQNFTSPGPNSTRIYTLNCTNSVGSTTVSATVTVPSLPTVSLTANYETDLWILPSTSFTLRWSTSNANSCTASGNWSGSKSLNGSQSIGGFSSGSRTYTLSCTNNVSGSTSRSVTVSIMPPIQSQAAYAIGNQLNQGFWRNNKGWSRTVPIVNGVVQWNSAAEWDGPYSVSTLPGSGDVQTQVSYVVGSTLNQGLWRGGQGWSRTVPIVNGVVQWNSATAWGGPYSASSLPGSGEIQSQYAFAISNTLYQGFWRNNQGYSRTVPIVNNVIQWGSATAWSGPASIANLPGSGDMQSQTDYVVGNTLTQGFWRGNQGWTRTVPIVNGVINWGAASAWSGPLDYSILPGGPSGNETAQANDVIVVDNTNTRQTPLGLAAYETDFNLDMPETITLSSYTENLIHNANDNSAVADSTEAEVATGNGYKGQLTRLATVQTSQVFIRRITYGVAGQTIAVKVTGDPVSDNNGLFYVYSDHLGSTTAMTNESGVQIGDVTRFYPFGSYRIGGANDISDSGFTGHKHNDDIGLIYMNARFYVPGIGRFASADTIVPAPTNPQSFNRYSYVFNSPLLLIDPSGHFTEEAIMNYLQEHYQDDAQYMFDVWKNDTEWWDMLRQAQAGDVLFASVGERELAGYYHFQGEGENLLTGVAGSLSPHVISDDYNYVSESLNQVFIGYNNTVWGGLFIKDGQRQIVDVLHRLSVTSIYEAERYMSTSSVETILRAGASAVIPEALCSPIGGFAAGVGCETLMGGMLGIAAPETMVGPDFVISPLGISPGDTIYVSAGHVFRYDAGRPSLDSAHTYGRLDMYYYGNSALRATYHLIVNYE